MRKIFLPPELYDWIKDFNLTDKWRLFDYIYKYNLWVDFEIKEDNLKIAFSFYKPFFDNDIKKHKEFCESRKNNWKKWWRPKLSTDEKLRKPRKPKKPTEMKWNEVKWSEIYIDNILYIDSKYIDIYKDYIEDFKNYWEEEDSKWTPRRKKEKTWNTSSRLSRWKKNADTNFWRIKTMNYEDENVFAQIYSSSVDEINKMKDYFKKKYKDDWKKKYSEIKNKARPIILSSKK